MGYYFYLDFDTDDKYSKAGLVKRFCDAGAEYGETIFRNGPEPWLGFELGFKDQYSREESFLVWLNKSPENIKEGRWAYIRLSWGTEDMRLYLRKMLEVAEHVGFRIYDPQVELDVTWETIDEIVEAFVKTAGNILGLFGTPRIDKEQKLLKKFQKEHNGVEEKGSAGFSCSIQDRKANEK